MGRRIEAEDLLTIKTVGEVQISPDGTRVAYTLTEIDPEPDAYRSSVWIVPAAGGEPVRLTRGPKRDSAPRWSPDGRWVAFLSNRDDEHPQLYVILSTGGEARRLTRLDGRAGPAEWSPDGTRLLFASRVSLEPPPAGAEARTRWRERPRVVTGAAYKADGAGYQLDRRSHLFVVDVAEGPAAQTRQITDGDAEDRAPAWSPDGRRIAWSRTRSGPADYNVSDIWTADAGGGHARRVTEDVGRATSPTWSPDGATLVCYGTDEQERGVGESIYRVWAIPADGGRPRALTAGHDRGVYLLPPPGVNPGPVWSADGTTLMFLVADAGAVHVARARVADGAVRPVVVGERQVTPLSVAGSRMAFAATGLAEPGDVWSCDGEGRDERRLTRVNGDVLAGLDLPRVERRAFPSPHGGTIEGWLVHPMRAHGPAPLLVHIHGGPHSFVGPAFPHSALYWYVLASRGWAVLALNPRGSGSYGRAFAHSVRGRWGEHDLPEQLGAIDTLVAEGVADSERLAVTGYSYGGYMTAWIVGHTDRFKAAVVGAPVTNLESFHGTSDIGMWFGPWEMRGDLVPSRETFRRLSPVNYVEHVTTPTLILHGEADDRCPIGQGEEFYAGLVAAGKAPTGFVRYPGQSHLFLGTGRPSHRVDYVRRVVDWVERHTLDTAPRP